MTTRYALLVPERRAAVDAHTARCDSCRRLVSELLRRSTLARGTPHPSSTRPRAELVPGAKVGRYVVRDRIGAGAMGMVFAAFDPELARAIALKILRDHDGAQGIRIQEEAKALARLSHPNVVGAYDLGEHDGDLVLAMELVDGDTVRACLAPGRSVPEILDVFLQAGRGLAAAHAAGLVHRDIKPDNILVGRDSRARIADFGLAAGPDGGTDLVGTPAYMAPEQFESGGADALSDQFAFCVSLFEALHGRRPFAINFLEEVRGGPRPSTSARRVPAYVASALSRGLHADPQRRFPSLTALLSALSPRAVLTPARVAIGGTVMTAAVVASAFAMRSSAPPLCRDSGAPFASMWTSARQQAVKSNLAASDKPYADAAWVSFSSGMQRFGESWSAASTDACQASRVRGQQSDQILTLRTACLAHALAEADELARIYETATGDEIARAAQAVDALPSLASCANVTALLAPIPPPSERDAAEVENVRRRLARVAALRDAASWTKARALATEIASETKALAHRPTRAAALFALGEALGGDGAAPDSERVLRDAFAAAEIGRDDLLAARIATELVFVVGQSQRRVDDGLQWAFHAETTPERAGGDRELGARIASNIAHIRFTQARYDEARTLYQQAFDARSELFGATSTRAARSLFNIGRAVMAQGDNVAALEINKRAIAMLETNLGATHPDLAQAYNGLASIEVNQGRYSDALVSVERALAIARPQLGELHPLVGQASITYGFVLVGLGRHADAERALGVAIAVYTRDGGDRGMLAEALSARGDARMGLGKKHEGTGDFQQALELSKEMFGPGAEQVASALERVAGAQALLGEHAIALAAIAPRSRSAIA